MSVKTIYGYIMRYEKCVQTEKGRLDTFNPITVISNNYKNWIAHLDPATCRECESRHGQIYAMRETVDPAPPLHPNCRCEIWPMESIIAGNATKDSENGADWWLKQYGVLPEYYITAEELQTLGWRRGQKPSTYAPGKMLTIGIYENNNGHLPQMPGRIWYEADINYYEGKRNAHRILWSNDGLIFVTYDHYVTFYEVI